MRLGDIQHSASIVIDEQGGEATAATAAVTVAKTFRVPVPVCAVDRAFLFAVVHRSTGLPLFIGRVSEPG